MSHKLVSKLKVIHEPTKLFIGKSKDSKYYIESFSPKYKTANKAPTRHKLNLFKKQPGKSYAKVEGITLEDKNLLEKVGTFNFNYAQFIFQVIKLKTGAEVFFVTRTDNNQEKSYYFVIEGDAKMTTIGTEEFYPVKRATELLIKTIDIHRKRGDIIRNNLNSCNDCQKNNEIDNVSKTGFTNDWIVVGKGKRFNKAMNN